MVNRQGQALIETALLLPLALFTFIVLLEFGLILHTHIRLHHTASRLNQRGASARTLGPVDFAELLPQTFPGMTWGTLSPARVRYQPLPEWKAYPGPWARHEPGMLQSVGISFQFFPHFTFGHWLPSIPLHIFSELPLEPRLPEDDA